MHFLLLSHLYKTSKFNAEAQRRREKYFSLLFSILCASALNFKVLREHLKIRSAHE